MANTINIDKMNIELYNDTKYYRKLSRYIGMEMSNITKPCYMPKLNRYESDLLKILNYKDEYTKEFKKNIPTKYKKFHILNDRMTLELINIFLYFSKDKNENISKETFLFLGLKFYGSMVHRMFPKFCDEKTWATSLDMISVKHLFKVRKGVSSTIVYLSNVIYEKYKRKISKKDVIFDDIFKMVYELRHRIAQSLKSFAENYYKILQQGTEEQQTKEDSNMVADKISLSICTYGQISKTALNSACKNSSLRKEIAESIVNEISGNENREDIRFIIILITRIDGIKNMCYENKRRLIVRKVTEGVKINNYNIKDKILNLINSLESSFRYRSINKNQLISFFSNYITLFIREKIC